MKNNLWIILVGVLLTSCAGPHMTQVVAFGSDFSDTGNYFHLAQTAVADKQFSSDSVAPFTNNWQNRLSNGPVAVEVMADQLGAGLTNYSVAAATSGLHHLEVNVKAYHEVGLLGQISQFKTDLKGEPADPNALYYIDISFIDCFIAMLQNPFLKDEDIAKISDLELNNLKTAITQLNQLGAKRFLVVPVGWARFPGLALGAPGLISSSVNQDFIDLSNAYLTQRQATLPAAMEELAKELDVDIIVFDYSAAEERILSNPGKYGLTNVTDPCTERPFAYDQTCSAPDQYYFWGYFYLSGRAHQVLGEMMAEQIRK